MRIRARVVVLFALFVSLFSSRADAATAVTGAA